MLRITFEAQPELLLLCLPSQAASRQTIRRQQTGDMQPYILRLLAAPTLCAAAFSSQAFDNNDQLSADGFLLGAGQCQGVSALRPGTMRNGSGSPPIGPNSFPSGSQRIS